MRPGLALLLVLVLGLGVQVCAAAEVRQVAASSDGCCSAVAAKTAEATTAKVEAMHAAGCLCIAGRCDEIWGKGSVQHRPRLAADACTGVLAGTRAGILAHSYSQRFKRHF